MNAFFYPRYGLSLKLKYTIKQMMHLFFRNWCCLIYMYLHAFTILVNLLLNRNENLLILNHSSPSTISMSEDLFQPGFLQDYPILMCFIVKKDFDMSSFFTNRRVFLLIRFHFGALTRFLQVENREKRSGPNAGSGTVFTVPISFLISWFSQRL